MRRPGFWIRWAARDLRARWVQVAVLGLVIAIGSGMYAGLTSTTSWRLASLDDSYEALAAHDLRVTLSEGSFVPQDQLQEAALGVEGVAGAQERLSLPTQLAVPEAPDDVLVSGRIVGVSGLDAAPADRIDTLEATAGRSLQPGDEGEPVAVVQVGFADKNEVPVDAELRLGDDVALQSVGHVTSPEWFMVVSDQHTAYAEATYGVVFTSLATAQEATGHEGEVNDLVVRAAAGVDVAALGDRLEAALVDTFPEVGFTATPLTEERGYRLLYDDAEQDADFFRVFAGVVLVGAAFGALNLSRRSVDRQRREIGVGLALGAPPRLLAVRPLLGGLQVALVGVTAGVVVGWLVSELMLDVMQAFVVLPVWHASVNPAVFAQAAAITVGLVMAGVAWPVARAVRVSPVEALQPRHLARATSRSRRGAGPIRRLLPSRTINRLPFGNVARAPQRLVLTVLALGAATALLLMTSTMFGSFSATIEKAEKALERSSPERLTVGLASPTLAGLPPATDVEASRSVAASDTALLVGATALGAGEAADIDLLLEVGDLDSDIWSPVDRAPAEAGLVLARKAAEDLGLSVGDDIVLEHPTRRGASSYALIETSLPVVALHDLPLRPLAFLDQRHADLLGLEDVVNQVVVVPKEGVPTAEVRRELFALDGVASVVTVGTTTDTYKEIILFFRDFLVVVEAFLVVLLVLVAFNATSLNVDERTREHATMLAMGVPLRTVLRTIVVENVLLGLAGAAVGLVAGLALLWWLVEVAVEKTLPDVDLVLSAPPLTVAASLSVAVLAVGLTPVLLARRISRLDLASSLRVVE